MLFKELRQGYPIYFFDRNSVSVKTGTVTNVGSLHVSKDPQKIANGNLAMVMDVTANVDGMLQQVEVSESAPYSVSKDGTILITPNKDDVLSALRMMRVQSEEALKMVESHKQVIEKCNGLIEDFDPVIKERRENDARINEMQKTIEQQSASIEELKSLLKNLAVRGNEPATR